MFVWLVPFATAAPPKPVHAQMQEHLAAAEAARDAVIAGDLATAQKKMAWIADNEPKLSGGAVAQFDTLQERARQGAESTTLMGAARGVAEVAGRCGACHAAMNTGPLFGAVAIPEGSDPKTHMQRHQWAADRLWEGLAAPDRGNWTAGALMLLEEPMHRPGDPGVDPGVAAVALRVHQFGSDTLNALTVAERVQLYGDFLATCAACHQATGGGPKSP
ncbi:MAG: hypothetical protein H6737_04545 [Alphaproteobacteria bacterium]|nr:hypothetical protein [Alphaproteobacteria bacterium]